MLTKLLSYYVWVNQITCQPNLATAKIGNSKEVTL